MKRLAGIALSLAICSTQSAPADEPTSGVPIRHLRHTTSWVGNSFGGDGGPNGEGYWIQNGADEIEVTPDGTVFAGITWDEAGRAAGLYKDGKVNRVLLKEHEGKGKESAWGWGTANSAVAASGEHLYLANTGKKLLRFRWKPGDINSARFVDEVEISGEAVGLTARDDRIAVVYRNQIELRRATDLATLGRFAVADARDAVLAADRNLWVLAENSVRQFSPDGKDLGRSVSGLDKPTAVSLDHQGRLLVCDDGRRQQVLIFDISGTPKQVSAFGDEGGLLSGTPGRVGPSKLFALRGAGCDAAGNMYVAMGFGGIPSGNFFLRSFDHAGRLRWELLSTAFVDTFGFDPESDGSVVYGRTTVFDLDLSQSRPGTEAALRAVTLDHVGNPDDDRIKSGCSVFLRRLQGRRLLYTIGQYGGGYRLYTFSEPDGQIAREVDRIHPEGETWAWDVDDEGGIWHGDAAGKAIHHYRFMGWKPDRKPGFDWKNPESWPWPADFELIRRVIYDRAGDSLYLFGYLKGQDIEAWGVIGRTARRYDGWLGGKRSERWTVRSLPVNPRGTDKRTALTPQAVDVVGDYLFLGMVKPDDNKQYTHVLRTADGGYQGSLSPGPEVGQNAGWQDMPYSVQALRRKDGEYLVLVEEDWRGKNLLYRWRPEIPSGESRLRD